MAYAFSLLTPEGEVFSGDVESVVVPGGAGFFGVLAGHAPMLAAVQHGILAVTTDEGRREYLIEDGVLETDGEKCLLLCDNVRDRNDDDNPVLSW